MQPPIILASSSPRRRQLLRLLDLSFDVDPSGIDETPPSGLTPPEVAVYLGQCKALDVAGRHPGATVIGADTLVDLDSRILNKPRDAVDAAHMLGLLAGRTHRVHSGLCVWRSDVARTALVSASVTMRAVSSDEIDAYVATGEPLDKAGAYAAQGLGAQLVAHIEGSLLAVVGLPLIALREMLLQAGVAVPAPLTRLTELDQWGNDQHGDT